MLDYKNLKDVELASHILQYTDRTDELMNNISDYLEGNKEQAKQEIQNRYKELKNEIKRDAQYLDLTRNKARDNQLYSRTFRPSIMEAAAFGFVSPVNSKIDFNFYCSVEEANYKLTKYYSRDEWNGIVNGFMINLE